MIFDTVQGNESVRQALTGMVDAGRVPHAIMFHENDGGGGIQMCLGFMECLMGGSPKVAKMIHPDIHFVFPVTGGSIISSSAKPTSLSYIAQWRELVLGNPYFTERDLNEALGIEGKSAIIAVAEARKILDKLAFNPLEGGYQAVIIYLPEKMNQETANRLLKSLEEPPERTEFLLVTHAPEKVLATISSRCQSIRLLPPESASTARDFESEEGALFKSLLAALMAKDLLSALEIGEELSSLPSRERMKEWCAVASEGCRQIFLHQQGLQAMLGADAAYWRELSPRLKKSFPRQALSTLDRARMLIERNVNAKVLFCDLVNRLFLLI